jgi:hypothetical protein
MEGDGVTEAKKDEWRDVEEKKERTSAEQPAEVVSDAAKEVDSKETDLEFENYIDAWASLPHASVSNGYDCGAPSPGSTRYLLQTHRTIVWLSSVTWWDRVTRLLLYHA